MEPAVDWGLAEIEVSYYQSSNTSMKLFVDRLDRNFRNYENAMYSLAMTNGQCLFCGLKLYTVDNDGAPWITEGSWDHLIPAAHFGLKTLGNLPLVCGSCNNEKGSDTAEDYWAKRSLAGRALWIQSYSEFKDFLHSFSTPYRDRFPRHYEMASRYSPGVSNDNQILIDYFLSPEEDGTLLLDFSSRWGNLRSPMDDDEVFDSIRDSFLDGEHSSSKRRICEHLRLSWSARADGQLFQTSIAAFSDYIDLNLRSAGASADSFEYSTMVDIFQQCSDLVARRDLKAISYSALSFRSYMKRMAPTESPQG